MALETWQELLDLNLTSVFICTKLIGKSMIDRGKGGRIINISSINSMVATKGIGGRSYETSKAAINSSPKPALSTGPSTVSRSTRSAPADS